MPLQPSDVVGHGDDDLVVGQVDRHAGVAPGLRGGRSGAGHRDQSDSATNPFARGPLPGGVSGRAPIGRAPRVTVPESIAHADRGSHYTSNDNLEYCQRHQLRPSVGRVATCFDNAVAESF